MKLLLALALLLYADRVSARENPVQRIVILKIDGLGADLLSRNMKQIDPRTGKSCLPWFAHIFGENGTIFQNFYTRGISLSAPSWSMLDTGHHTVIRGNVEYDRFTGEVYDYLNFFPFYLGYARSREVDMPGVEVLDRTGIPLIIDNFGYTHVFQSFQLFQRGVRWTTLARALKRRFSSKAIFSMVEDAGAPSFGSTLTDQMEAELEATLERPETIYLDLFTGDMDHEGHATNQPAALLDMLQVLDSIVGRIWTAIQKSGLGNQTIFAVVSDHGMNNVPGIVSQTFSLPDLLNSPQGGAHHVITNRHQLSDYKLAGLDPLVRRVITPSRASFYLEGKASQYPTVWLDIDGNERASVYLRSSDLNKIHILLLQLSRQDLSPNVRQAAATYLHEIIDRHRAHWTEIVKDLDEEMNALSRVMEARKKTLAMQPRKWNSEQRAQGDDKAYRRQMGELQSWIREQAAYTNYIAHLRDLLALQPDARAPFRGNISELIPELTLGDSNTVAELQHYVVGPPTDGLGVDSAGRLDPDRSFRYVNYPALLTQQHVANNPQSTLTDKPVDFIATRLPDFTYESGTSGTQHAYWICGDESNQLLVVVDQEGRIAVRPIQGLTQDRNGKINWRQGVWRPGLPLHLYEDPELQLGTGTSRAEWLSAWHTEHDWLEATHRCRYSNGIIGITEELSPVAENVPGQPGMDPVLLRYERRRRELVQADFQVFAADHWNFNVRFPNPGGNHGSFFRISTHSVWMLAGNGVPHKVVHEPYDSLNFAATILSLAGIEPPIPSYAVPLQ